MSKNCTLGDYRRFVEKNRDAVLSCEADCVMLASFYSALVEENSAKDPDDLPDDLILGEKTSYIFNAIQSGHSFLGAEIAH